VATATASDMTVPLLGGRHHFLLRRLHSLTGLVFGGYLVVHLLVNATIAQLGTVYQVQVNKIHELPLLWGVEWVFIFLPIIFHTVYGIWITLTGQPNVGSYPYGKNWFYLLQRASAIIIVLFMIFHVLTLKYGIAGHDSRLTFDPENAAYTVHRHMSVSPFITWFVYPVGIIASCYHLANGFWTAAITWGLTVSAAAQRRWGAACAGLFVVTLIFGMTALVASATHDFPSAAPKASVGPVGIEMPAVR
jgi:succinate dehydrogenase / fumarate reductase cytochrome b subunit